MKKTVIKINVLEIIILSLLFLFFFDINHAQIKQSILDLNRDDYLKINGEGYIHGAQSIWAWFENDDTTKSEQIHDIIQFWGSIGEASEPYIWRWRVNWDLTCVLLARILYQYGDQISKSDSLFLERKFTDFIKKSSFHKYNFNNRIYDYTLRYLHSQYHKNISVYYPSGLPNFSWDGRYYKSGNYYNSYKISRDWLFWRFSQLAFRGNYELDSYYTMAMVVCLYTIYDLSMNKEMKKRAKMVLDLILLDSTMDFSAGLHGGWLGRNYSYGVLAGQPNIYQWIYWKKGVNPEGSVLGSLYDAYVSNYRLPGVIEDIGVLKDEPDNYWHLHIESNESGGLDKDNCKWTYVTKFYNIGGSENVLSRAWQLNIASNDEKINYPHVLLPVKSIKVWIDDKDSIPEYQDSDHELPLGLWGYQYKNFLMAKVYGPYLHFGGLGNVFDVDETISDWRFLKEGNVAVAIKMTNSVSAIEVCTIGVDYDSFEDFKNAILANAQLIPSYSAQFINSHDDTLMNVINNTYFNGKKIKYSPQKRIYTTTNIGDKIILWNDGIMTVQRHGRKSIYNFNNWTYKETGMLTPQPPTPISIEKINNIFNMNFSSVEGASFYNVYRDTFPEFIPNSTNLIASGIMNIDLENTVNYCDTLDNIPYTSILYKITSASGNESSPSAIMGKYHYNLYTTGATNFNSIALPFQTESIVDAEDLCNMIPFCNSIAKWDANNQTFIQYIKNLNINNFTVSPGNPYHANVTNDSYFSHVGIPTDPTFNLFTTEGTDFNEIMLPLNRDDITDASQLSSDIPYCNSVACWDPKKQYYKQYIAELPFTDFKVKVGYPYLINVTDDVVWPGGGTPKIFKKSSDKNILFQRKRIPHLVWGKINSNASDLTNAKINQFEAFITLNPQEKINQNSPDCSMQTSYWKAQISNFKSGWKIGDTLRINFKNTVGDTIESINVILTSKAFDKVKFILSNNNDMPTYFNINQNYPNPFNQETLIQFETPESSNINITVYNINGQKIKELVHKNMQAGYHSIKWNGTNSNNCQSSSGIYFINMATQNYSKTIKVLLVR